VYRGRRHDRAVAETLGFFDVRSRVDAGSPGIQAEARSRTVTGGAQLDGASTALSEEQ
jgi:hypothetical protein